MPLRTRPVEKERFEELKNTLEGISEQLTHIANAVGVAEHRKPPASEASTTSHHDEAKQSAT